MNRNRTVGDILTDFFLIILTGFIAGGGLILIAILLTK